jgi:hypothetical protein
MSRIHTLAKSCFHSVRAVAALLAITSVSVTGQAATVRDSAGVTIVENLPLQPTSMTLRVSNRPALVLGEERSGPTHEFQGITNAVRLSDGTIVVGNASSSEIRFFKPDGTHKASAGRRGQGPGEFTSLAWIQRAPGDTVIAYDRSRRIALFDPSGKFVRSHVVAGPPVGRFADGSYLFSTRLPQAIAQENGLKRDSSRFSLATSDATGGTTVGVFPNSDLPFTVTIPSTSASGRAMMSQVGYPQPFGRVTSALVSGTEFLVAEGSTYELRTYAPNGALKRIVRLQSPRMPVSSADRATYIRELVASSAPEQRENTARLLADASFPTSRPAFGAVRVDDKGRLWVEDFPFPADSARRWTVFGADGRALTRIAVPAELRVVDIGGDYVVGLRKDDMGRELVVVLGARVTP